MQIFSKWMCIGCKSHTNDLHFWLSHVIYIALCWIYLYIFITVFYFQFLYPFLLFFRTKISETNWLSIFDYIVEIKVKYKGKLLHLFANRDIPWEFKHIINIILYCPINAQLVFLRLNLYFCLIDIILRLKFLKKL